MVRGRWVRGQRDLSGGHLVHMVNPRTGKVLGARLPRAVCELRQERIRTYPALWAGFFFGTSWLLIGVCRSHATVSPPERRALGGGQTRRMRLTERRRRLPLSTLP